MLLQSTCDCTDASVSTPITSPPRSLPLLLSAGGDWAANTGSATKDCGAAAGGDAAGCLEATGQPQVAMLPPGAGPALDAVSCLFPATAMPLRWQSTRRFPAPKAPTLSSRSLRSLAQSTGKSSSRLPASGWPARAAFGCSHPPATSCESQPLRDHGAGDASGRGYAGRAGSQMLANDHRTAAAAPCSHRQAQVIIAPSRRVSDDRVPQRQHQLDTRPRSLQQVHR